LNDVVWGEEEGEENNRTNVKDGVNVEVERLKLVPKRQTLKR
jgi:hypothetical protein